MCDGGPHGDTRNARKLPGGNYLVAHEREGAVREYSPAGAVVWEYVVAVEPNGPRPAGQLSPAQTRAVISSPPPPPSAALYGDYRMQYTGARGNDSTART